MKIGFLLDSTLDSTDGVQQFVLTLGSYMTSQGHDVHYIVGETHRKDIANIHSLGKNVTVSFNGNKISSPLPVSKSSIHQLLQKLELDIIHVQTPFSPFFAGKVLKLAKSRGISVVSTFHILPYGGIAKVGNAALGLWLRAYNRYLTTCIAVSEPASDYALASYGQRCKVIPNPINLSVFRNQSIERAGKNIRIVFLGRLVARKGALQLVKAIAYIQEHKLSNNTYTVIIGGKGEQYEDIATYIQRHNLTETVTMAGFIQETNKVQFLSRSDIAVFPSTSGESFGISLLEAFATTSGVVLAGDNPGYRSVMPDANQLLDTSNTRVFAQTLAWWIDNAEARKEAFQRQRTHVAKFDISIVGKAYEATYVAALNRTEKGA